MTRRLFLAGSLGLALAACFPHHTGRERPPRADIAAISDLHLGDPRSLLNEAEGREVLLEEIAEACSERGVHTLVLDGDVLELALASETSAFHAARELFRELDRVRGLDRVVVIVGNHDHRLFEAIPDPLHEKLGKEYDEGTRFHREIDEAVSRVRVTLVYPGWTVPVKDGKVHFTHGHYFDRVVTPAFDETKSMAEVEEANQEWWSFLNAGGVNRTVREIYRSAYHFGHHIAGLVDSIEGAEPDEEPREMSRREQERVEAYIGDQIRDPEVHTIVSGHTHANGGRIQKVLVHGKETAVIDPGAFVVGHHGRPAKPHMVLVDTKKGEIRVEKIKFPEEIVDTTLDRAFSTVP